VLLCTIDALNRQIMSNQVKSMKIMYFMGEKKSKNILFKITALTLGG